MPTSVRRRSRHEEDDEPRGVRRYADADADEDDEPRRSRRRGELPDRGRSRDDDDDDRGSRRSRSRDDDDDQDDDEPRRSRRSRGRDDDDDEPRRGRGGSLRSSRSRDDDDDGEGSRGQTVSKANEGWDAWKKEAKSNFTNHDFKVDDDDAEVIIKFLDDEPFHSYQQHWIQERNGKKGFLCLRDLHQDCPLCDAGHDERRALGAFNVVKMGESGDVELMVWSAGSGIMSKIEKKAQARTGPLSVHYYAVSKVKPSSGKGVARFEIELVREADLKDYDIEPLTDKELDDFEDKKYAADYFKYPTKAELRSIAREWARDED